MPRTPSINFANVICKFGEAFVLLDLAEQVIFPAFFDPSLRRKYGETEFLFLDIGWFAVPARADKKSELCIYGRLVKDTLLHRDQILADGHLVQNHESLPSAPSAFFLLMLSNHKLVYLPETSGAPTLEVFGSTLQYFFRAKHAAYIRAEYARRKGTLTETTRLALLEEIPAPTVEVLPLASKESISEFVESIEKLTHLEFRILDTNREFQMEGPYRKIREDKEALRAKSSKLIYDNSEGMNKPEVTNQIAISAATGNQYVIVAGTAADGTAMRGNNNQFSLHVPAGDLPEAPNRKGHSLLDKFGEQVTSGNLSLDAQEDNSDRIETLRNRLEGADGNPRN
jgi:hypothetical protein